MRFIGDANCINGNDDDGRVGRGETRHRRAEAAWCKAGCGSRVC
jgi:hypothetical protein